MEDQEILLDDSANSLEVRVEDEFIVLAGEVDGEESWEIPLSTVEAARLRDVLTRVIEGREPLIG